MRILFIAMFSVLSVGVFLVPFFLTAETKPSDSQSSLPAVPKLGAYNKLPDFTQFSDVHTKKSEFFSYLLPVVEAENLRILHQRKQLLQIERDLAANMINDADRQQFAQLVREYEVDERLSTKQQLEVLKRRVDVVPEMMVLVQAANESAWGTSRFARKGLNLFGQWCYREGCGLVPNQRPEGQVHEVAKFDSVKQSIRSYMRNINTHDPYLDLRIMRAEKREQEKQILAMELVKGLGSYSERGDEYIEELQAMIRVNRPIVNEIKQQQAEVATAN